MYVVYLACYSVGRHLANRRFDNEHHVLLKGVLFPRLLVLHFVSPDIDRVQKRVHEVFLLTCHNLQIHEFKALQFSRYLVLHFFGLLIRCEFVSLGPFVLTQELK